VALFQPIARQFDVAIAATQSSVRLSLIALAKSEHSKIMNAEPRPVRFTRFVDGRRGALEEEAKGNSVIHYDYPRLEIVVEFAMNALYDFSPVRSGEYRNSHQIFVNGLHVANLKDINEGQEIAISNTVPYARKIEVGAMTMRVPGTDHVYQQAAQLTRRRMGNLARIEFTFRSIFGGKSAGNRFPALIIGEKAN
jgi:hypothetical protein